MKVNNKRPQLIPLDEQLSLALQPVFTEIIQDHSVEDLVSNNVIQIMECSRVVRADSLGKLIVCFYFFLFFYFIFYFFLLSELHTGDHAEAWWGDEVHVAQIRRILVVKVIRSYNELMQVWLNSNDMIIYLCKKKKKKKKKKFTQ